MYGACVQFIPRQRETAEGLYWGRRSFFLLLLCFLFLLSFFGSWDHHLLSRESAHKLFIAISAVFFNCTAHFSFVIYQFCFLFFSFFFCSCVSRSVVVVVAELFHSKSLSWLLHIINYDNINRWNWFNLLLLEWIRCSRLLSHTRTKL